ncbi:SDR family NAD(P)-dependent oxidoreductase [Planctobacterium marinum]|uniref:20-beta-hydroxysteroid dehydrogenase n=1 Tax=Planctobacterium marinum TaxID=1631968 RepID=A0AA48HDZ9_9ALTE|nr:20-beta-hydroxysteroid dehydrogenase [Planctobacterium marinum]
MTRTALVTGGNRGIGLEVVKGYAEKGMKVILACRDVEQAKASLAGETMGDIHPITLDLSSHAAIDESCSKVTAIYGDIDVLVNNAGILHQKQGTEASTEELSESMQIHLNGPYNLIKQALPAMLRNGFGRIINVSSGWGSFTEGMEGPLPYAVSKAALNALTANLAKQLAASGQNVTINSVCPGWVHTRMGGKDAPRTPEQGADTIVWLGTLESDCPNGKFLRDRQEISW